MPIFISEQLNQYIKDKYEIDLSNDDNISTKSYNPHGCLARVWGSDPEFIANAGGYTDLQCSNAKSNGFYFCECHTIKFFEGKLSFGRIDEDPPEEPIIEDIDGNKTRYYWLKDSDGMKKDEIFLKEEEEKQENYSKRRGRGRPPTKKILYKEIDWKKLYEEDKIDTLPLNTLKEYLQKNNLYLYGKKEEIVRRINEHFERID